MTWFNEFSDDLLSDLNVRHYVKLSCNTDWILDQLSVCQTNFMEVKSTPVIRGKKCIHDEWL